MRLVNYHFSKSRLQQGGSVGSTLLKLAKILGPSALKVLEGAAEGVGKKVGKLISGEGLGVQGLQAEMVGVINGAGSRLAGGGSRLAGGGSRLAGSRGGTFRLAGESIQKKNVPMRCV